jgi:hypothetical protein
MALSGADESLRVRRDVGTRALTQTQVGHANGLRGDG